MSIFPKTAHWIKQFIADPEYKICQRLLRFVKPDHIPDRIWLKYEFHYVFGRPLNLKNPKTFNEKLQWLKLFNRNPLYTTMVDKCAVKRWVAERIGWKYIIPTLAEYDHASEIDINKLPDKFVLKCNHDSGSVIICKDKRTFDINSAKAELDAGMKT